ncbi:unnamed protein product [Ophioblennius macclurei]
MDAEGARPVRPKRRINKLAVVVAVQNLLLVLCLLLTFFVYRGFQASKADFETWTSQGGVHIRFSPSQPLSQNSTLVFKDIASQHLMDLTDKRDQISIKCTGFYVWHVKICHKSLQEVGRGALQEGGRGTLQLRATGSETPISSFALGYESNPICRELNNIVYLKRNQLASVQLIVTRGFKIINMNMELSYLWWKQCAY